MARRRAVSIRRVLHLLLVAAGAVGLWLSLSALVPHGNEPLEVTLLGREVSLQEPRWLWGLLLLPWLWLVPGFGLSDLPAWQQGVSTIVRSALLVLLLAGLSGLSTVRREERVALALLADVSESVTDVELSEVERFVLGVREAAQGRPMRLVTFAARPREVVLPVLGDEGSLERLPEGGPRTDVEAALKMAYGLFPPDHHKRVVLLSDGKANEGITNPAALSLMAQGRHRHLAQVPGEIEGTQRGAARPSRIQYPPEG